MKSSGKITLYNMKQLAKKGRILPKTNTYKSSHLLLQVRLLTFALLTVIVSGLGLSVLVVAQNSVTNTAHADGIWAGPESLFEGKWPAIKVRPTDGDVFVIATDYISTIMFGDADSGYNPVVIASSDGTDPARPRAAFDNSGVLHVVWMARDINGSGDYDIFYCEISTTGTVSTPRDLTKELGLGVGRFPDLAVSPVDGKLYLAMEADNAVVGVSVSSDNGAHFGKLSELGSGIAGNTGTRIAVGTDGTAHFVYEDGTDIIAEESSDGGSHWTGPTKVDNLGTLHNRSFWPSIDTGPSGDAYVAWQEDSQVIGIAQISFAHWSHTTKSWLPETRNISEAATGDSAEVPNVAVANSVGVKSGTDNTTPGVTLTPIATTSNTDTVWVSWEIVKGDGSGGADYVLSNDSGQTFGSVVSASNSNTTTATAGATTVGGIGIGVGNTPTTVPDITSTPTGTGGSNTTTTTGPGVIAAPTYSRAGPWNDMTYGAGQVWWAGQLADDSGVYQIWLATTGPNQLNGTGSISLFPPGINTPNVVNQMPTPTVPSWSRPNLHLYFRDGSNQPIGGVRATLYSYSYNPSTKQSSITQLATNTSDGVTGRVDFDAFALTPGIYYLKLVTASGATVLPSDPNLPLASGDVGNPDPILKDMTLLDLTRGAVVYVNTYYFVPAKSANGQLVAAPNLAKALIYYPPVGSELAAISPGPSVTPTAGQPVPANSNTPYVVFTSQAMTATIAPTLVGFTPVAGGGYIGGVDSSNYGVTPGAMGQAHPNSTYAPQPTPTLSCQIGCVQQGNNPVANREAMQAATAQAQTVIAQLTEGVLQAGEGGFRGNGSTSQYNPNPLNNGSTSGIYASTPQVTSNNTITTTSNAAFISNSNSGGDGNPLTIIFALGGVSAAVVGGSVVGAALKGGFTTGTKLTSKGSNSNSQKNSSNK